MKHPVRLLGQRVKISKTALLRAKKEYGTQVSSHGTVTSVGGGLVTVRHNDGQEVDWNNRSVSLA